MGLKSELEKFSLKKVFSDIDTSKLDCNEIDAILDSKLYELAKSFLCGGYISVKDQSNKEVFRIFLQTIEYYIHTEKDCTISVQDEIMYHRNNKGINGKYPYLPLMSLHAHDSGYDITFENENEKYRASVLIREYVIIDMLKSSFIVWNPSCESFVQYELSNKKNPVNSQSTYLKKLLTGFSLEMNGYHPIWIDIETMGNVNKGKHRKGIPNKYTSSIHHKWQFSRKGHYTLENCLYCK